MSYQIHDNKHLTLNERKIIETGIINSSNKVDIARTIGKDPTTVAKEIRKHRILTKKNTFNRDSICIHLNECGRYINKCNYYEEPKCNQRDRSSGACNGCPNMHKCYLDKYFYSAKQAHREYKEDSVDFREGINITTLERKELAYILKPLLDKGHTYKDYLNFKNNNPDTPTTEMDTVMNSLSGPYIQTFYFEESGVMIGFLHQDKTSRSMSSKLDYLENMLGYSIYRKLFSLILTDKSPEFEIMNLFEFNGETGELRTNIFYFIVMLIRLHKNHM